MKAVPRTAAKPSTRLRRDDWKLLQDSPFQPLELYNLRSDPLETTDLAAKNRKLFNELDAALRKHIQQAGSAAWQASKETRREKFLPKIQ